jgi:hypothetical protein
MQAIIEGGGVAVSVRSGQCVTQFIHEFAQVIKIKAAKPR